MQIIAVNVSFHEYFNGSKSIYFQAPCEAKEGVNVIIGVNGKWRQCQSIIGINGVNGFNVEYGKCSKWQ